MNKIIKHSLVFLRIAIGLVMLFSGFVKGVDPLGTTYKFNDYFGVVGLTGMYEVSFWMAGLMNLAEFMIGLALIFNVFTNFTMWLALLLMSFFTILTFLLAYYNPITDCGCFGDALKVTNWQTFFKNLIFISIIILLFINRKRLKSNRTIITQWSITSIGVVAFITLTIYCYTHLPIIDFRPYKIGTYLPSQMTIPEGAPSDVYEQYFVLEDTSNETTLKIESNQYIQDSTYWYSGTKWKFVSTTEPKLIKKGYEPPIHGFSISDKNGNDITNDILSDTAISFLLITYNIDKANDEGLKKANQLYLQSQTIGSNRFYAITASSEGEINKKKKALGLAFDFYTCDEIVLKTIVRSNPGLVMLKEGVVLDMWHYNDFPVNEKKLPNLASALDNQRKTNEWLLTILFFITVSTIVFIVFRKK